MRRFLLVGLIITAFVLSACGGSSTPEPTAAPAAQPTAAAGQATGSDGDGRILNFPAS
ncbi:MAG: hypothetical protein H6647_18040 [Anaerolineales bacterium]|nr:hypothetical protein [Anaerolineales bacterium]